ncbi:MAG: hypothetical protein JW940_20365 [Polyangiaceae bacterium]|nr:hypothetical protein [Polyangiaceae bacterium]
MAALHHIYLVPGMFGFGRLAGYDYFHHVREALRERFEIRGQRCVTHVVSTAPTSSLRLRARILAQTVRDTAGADDAPIHLLGHSTGGLDVRLVLSPSSNLGIAEGRTGWVARTRSATTMSCPHYGTPLAGYFSTVSGTRVLYALSLLTVLSLSLGGPSLAVFSKMLGALGGVDSLLGGDLKLVSRVTDLALRFVDQAGRAEISGYLERVQSDQGGIIQVMPEAMDLFNAATENDAAVRYGSVATSAPFPQPTRLIRRIWHPYAALTAALYSTLYQFSSQKPRTYPYAEPSEEQERMLGWCGSDPVTPRSNDGVVPTLSMVWGKLIWCGEGDHLDVLGHFHDDQKPRRHVDWMTSGARFNRERFASLMDAVARFQLEAAEPQDSR